MLEIDLPLLTIYVDPGSAVLRVRHEVVWGTTGRAARNTVPYDLTQIKAWRHTSDWTLWLAPSHRVPYGLRLEAKWRGGYGDMRMHRIHMHSPYADAQQCRSEHRSPYGDVPLTRARWIARYEDLSRVCCSARFPYWLTESTAQHHVVAYSVTNADPVRVCHTMSWALLAGQHLQAVMNTPELTWNGQTMRIIQATFSCDEESPVWIATVEVAEIGDFAAIGIGDTITLTLGLETFVLVVDGKTLSRESVADQHCELSAVSPIALLDAPFAGTMRFYQPGAVSAEAAVESLIGPVTWELPNWIIPAGRLMLEGVTPLAAARNIVAAIGGIVESNPDGSVVCRRRHPVSIPQYGQATVAHSLFDSDVMSTHSQIAPSRKYNRVTIANEDGASGSSLAQIEFVADANDANRGTVRAYLAKARAVVLTHTGHAATVIASLDEVTRREIETVEFVEGRANTRYPVTAIASSIWQHTDLGAVTADGQNLVASTPGYSLLAVTYTTTSLDWSVALSLDEEVQFVLVEN